MSIDIKKISEYFDSEEGQDYIQKYKQKLKTEELNREKWVNHFIRRISKLNDSELEILLTRFFSWEHKIEERYYDNGIQTSSNLIDVLFDVFKTLGEEFDSFEDFYGGGYIYRGYVFKLFVGQGSFFRVLKGKETIFQSS